MRIRLAAILISAGLVVPSCLPEQYSGQSAVQARAASLTSLLEANANATPEQLASLLHDFQTGASDNEKAEAAYILARVLQQSTTYNPSLADTKTNGTDNLMEAMRLFDESSSIPALAERSAWHIADIAATIGDEERARTALEYLKRKLTDPHRKAAAEYAIGQSYMRAKETDKAQPTFTAIRKNYPESEFAKACVFYLAEIVMADPQPSADALTSAAQLYRQYLKSSPDGRFAMDAVAKLKALAKNNALELSATDHELAALAYFDNQHWGQALDEWAQAKPDTQLTKQAICLAYTGKTNDAIQVLLQAIRAKPTISYEATAALIANYLNRDDTKKFWQQIAAAHPTKGDAPLWNIALRSKSEEAVPLYKALIANYPTCEFAPEALWWLFWDGYKEAHGDPAKLQATLTWANQCVEKYPTTKAAAKLAFWTGKVEEHLHRVAAAHAAYQFVASHFPSYYYGHRAKARLRALSPKAGAPKAPSTVADPATDAGWTTKAARVPPDLKWQWPSPQEILDQVQIDKRYGATFSELLKLHQFDECLEILPPEANSEFKAAILAKMHRPLQAINAANKDIEGSPHQSDRWITAYPLEYATSIADNAKANGVDPLLVHALIREESRYNSDAISRSKAIGLMQLMPGTAYGVAKRLAVPLSGTKDVYTPATNIKLGTNYLAVTIKRFNGNALLAVASYNGGPNAVTTWFNQHKLSGSSDFDVFVENIPFRETRDYVRKVFGSYWTYEEIYAGKKI